MSEVIAQKINEFFTRYPKREYPKGQILIFADETPEHVYYIVSGRIRCYDVSYRGDEVIVNLFKSPAFFPMSWAINRTPNTFFYKTEIATTVHVVPADEALQFIKDNPDVMLDLLSRLYRGIDGLLGRVVHLMSGSARSRLLYELIIECRRFGEADKANHYTLAVSEIDLAARSGLSRETVSREMKKMKQDGLVSVSPKGIVVTDMQAIEKKLGLSL